MTRNTAPQFRKNAEGYGCTAAIITAVPIEENSVRNLFDGWEQVDVPGDPQIYETAAYEAGGGERLVVTAKQPYMGMTAASMLAAKMIYTFRPKYLIMCGIAAGIGEESAQLYGDVLVPDMIWDYSTGKFVGKNESEIAFGSIGFQPRPISVRIDPEMLAIVMETLGREDNEFHIHVGPMACGTTVVANREIVDKRIHALFPHTVGLDMESYSIYYAAEHCAGPRPRALVVKSICDYADSEKSDQYQKFAAFTSSGYVKYLLENYLY
ncbi:MAG: hypothetical protein K6B12_03475 [Clostridiales bacterium]|nr:hypothetical protein [Clostridiales bacterium]